MNTGSNGTEMMVAAEEPRSADRAGTAGETADDQQTGATGEKSAEKAERPLGSRAPAYIQARRTLHLSWQVGVFVVGLAVVAAGAAMLVLPGPGWFVIFAGMAIWATEFVWAQLVLRWTRRKVSEAAQRALDPRVRRRNIILTTIGCVICAVLAGIYLWQFGLTLPWKIEY
jgi:uncharacterized protein (TIGR02611 family)